MQERLPLYQALVQVSAGESAYVRSLFPASRCSYFECRLANDDSQLDYLVAFPRSLATRVHRTIVERDGFADATANTWTPVERFFALWCDGRSIPSRMASTVWLEFDDVGANTQGIAAPSLCVCLLPEYRPNGALTRRTDPRDLQLAHSVLETVGLHVSDWTGALTSCFQRLPVGGRWIHLSVMVGRSPWSVKLYGTVPRSAVLPYLREIGWRGSYDAVDDLLAKEYAQCLVGDELFIDLNLTDFQDATQASLGLAVSQQQLFQAGDGDIGRQRVLDTWISAGLCSSERAAFVRNWLGVGPQMANVPNASRFLDLKLVLRTGSPVVAKAYLGEYRNS